MPKALPQSAIETLFSVLQAEDPEPSTELNYDTTFQLLVAVVLSAQSTDKGVNVVTESLFSAAPDAVSMVSLGEASIREHIKRLGLYKNKAKHVHQAAIQLVDEFDGEVPNSREALQSLPGVGRKTANVILNVAYGEPTMAVDTHVFRVSNRTGLAVGKTPEAVEKKLVKVIPKKYMQHAHHWLILHGRYTCVARKPKCDQCPIVDVCGYASANKN